MEVQQMIDGEWITLCPVTFPAGGYLQHMCESPIGHGGAHSWERFVNSDLEDKDGQGREG